MRLQYDCIYVSCVWLQIRMLGYTYGCNMYIWLYTHIICMISFIYVSYVWQQIRIIQIIIEIITNDFTIAQLVVCAYFTWHCRLHIAQCAHAGSHSLLLKRTQEPNAGLKSQPGHSFVTSLMPILDIFRLIIPKHQKIWSRQVWNVDLDNCLGSDRRNIWVPPKNTQKHSRCASDPEKN